MQNKRREVVKLMKAKILDEIGGGEVDDLIFECSSSSDDDESRGGNKLPPIKYSRKFVGGPATHPC